MDFSWKTDVVALLATTFFSWKTDVVAWLATTFFMAVTLMLLALYDGHVIFDWHGVTLNAIVSLLSTASRASLLFALAESVGQWKWILFANSSRPLLDLNRIDAASRGPLGSLLMLWPSRKISSLRLGVIVTVLATALDPFAQQLIQYEQRPHNVTTLDAIIARADHYDRSNVFQFYEPPTIQASPDFSMQSAILYGLAQPYETVAKQTSFSCTAGNCSWTPFDSLAVCSRCKNLRAKLRHYPYTTAALFASLGQQHNLRPYGPGSSYALPNGLFMSNTENMLYAGPVDGIGTSGWVYLTAYGTGNASRTNSFQDSNTLIWAMSFIKIKPPPAHPSYIWSWPDVTLEALECALYYCVKQYAPEVVDSSLREVEVTATNSTRAEDIYVSNNVTFKGSLLFENQTVNNSTFLTRLRFDNGYNVSQKAIDGISAYMQSHFSIGSDYHNPKIAYDSDDLSARTIAAFTLNGYCIGNGAPLYNPPVMQVFYESSNISDTFRSVAKSMSNNIRANSNTRSQAIGISSVMATHYRIEWPWISLHATLIIAGMLFFIVTVLKTNRLGIPVLKSNALAPLAQASELGNPLDGLRTKDAINKEAAAHRVQLFRNEGHQSNDGQAVESMKSHQH